MPRQRAERVSRRLVRMAENCPKASRIEQLNRSVGEQDLVFKTNIRTNRYSMVFKPRSPSWMPCAVESSNRGKRLNVRQMSKSDNGINRIVSVVFKDGFNGSRTYSHRVLSFGASRLGVASSEKTTAHLNWYAAVVILKRATGQELPRNQRTGPKISRRVYNLLHGD
jgi:hypothetical protein